MLRNSTAGLPRVTKSSRTIRTLLAVICGKHVTQSNLSEQGVEINNKERGSQHLERNDGGIVPIDYEDLKKTGYLEVVNAILSNVNMVAAMAQFSNLYVFSKPLNNL